MTKLIRSLGALAQGYLAGRKLKKDEQATEADRKMREEENRRKRKAWEREDATYDEDLAFAREKRKSELQKLKDEGRKRHFELYEDIPKIADPLREKLGGMASAALPAASGVGMVSLGGISPVVSSAVGETIAQAAPKATSRFPEFGVESIPRETPFSFEAQQDLERLKQAGRENLAQTNLAHRLRLKKIAAQGAADRRIRGSDRIPLDAFDTHTKEELEYSMGRPLTEKEQLLMTSRQRKAGTRTQQKLTSQEARDADAVSRVYSSAYMDSIENRPRSTAAEHAVLAARAARIFATNRGFSSAAFDAGVPEEARNLSGAVGIYDDMTKP